MREKLVHKLISPNQTVLKEATLTSLLECMTAEESEDTLIVIFVAETDLEHVANISSLVEEKFPEVVTIFTSINQFFPHPAHTLLQSWLYTRMCVVNMCGLVIPYLFATHPTLSEWDNPR